MKKRMLKGIFAALMACTMAFAMTACGSNADDATAQAEDTNVAADGADVETGADANLAEDDTAANADAEADVNADADATVAGDENAADTAATDAGADAAAQ